MISPDQLARTAQRYEARTSQRAGTEAKLSTGAILTADTPERVRTRLVRKGIDPTLAADMVSGAISIAEAGASAPRLLTTLERMIGRDNLMNATFLTEGARACRAVCRIEICEPSGLVAGYGTGVMVSPRLMITNNHVLETATRAAASQAEFGLEEDSEGRVQPSVRFALEPDTLFATNPELDYSVVAVSSTSGDGQPLERFGWVPLIEATGKVIKGECLNIIQHPNGDPKRLALRENHLVDLLDDFIHYKTDTAPGSSGSPVFNDEWEMVALHHSGVPARDAEGNVLAVDGGVWTEDMGEHRVKWVANEGVRVSRLIAHLRTQQLTDAQRLLLEEAISRDGAIAAAAQLPGAEPEKGFVLQRLPASPANGHASPAEATAASTPSAASADSTADMVVTWTIPIQVSARLGLPTAGSPMPFIGPSLPSVVPALPTPISGPGNAREWATLAERRRGHG